MKKLLSLLVLLCILSSLLCVPISAADNVRYEFETDAVFEDGGVVKTNATDIASGGAYLRDYENTTNETRTLTIEADIPKSGLYSINYASTDSTRTKSASVLTFSVDGTVIGKNDSNGTILKNASGGNWSGYANTSYWRSYSPDMKLWLDEGAHTVSVFVERGSGAGGKLHYYLDYFEFEWIPAEVISEDDNTRIEFEQYSKTKSQSDTENTPSGEYYVFQNEEPIDYDPSFKFITDVEKSGYYNITYVVGKKTTENHSAVAFKSADEVVGTNEADNAIEVESYNEAYNSEIPMSKYENELVWLEEGENVFAVEIGTRSDGNYLFQMDYIEFEPVKPANITVQNTEEIPGIDANLYLSIENGKNVHVISFSLTFDKDAITAKENITVSDEFEIVSVSQEEGKLTAELKRKTPLGKEAIEFCVVPIKVAADAELKEYQIEIEATTKGRNDIELGVNAIAGTLNVLETTPKYDSLNDAVAALSKLTKAEDIKIDDYYSELSKVIDAREKVETAYGLSVRESQLGTDLIENLKASEKRLAEIKLYYDALDNLEKEETETIGDFIKANKDYFEITDEAVVIYDRLEDTSKVDAKIADSNFDKPSDVYVAFHEVLVLEATKQTGWQNLQKIFKLAEESTELDLTDYNKLDADQKAEVDKEIAMDTYDTIDELQKAVDSEVSAAKKATSGRVPSGSGGGSGSGSKKNNQTIVVKPVTEPEKEEEKEPEKTPEQQDVFSDISAYGWAKDAIKYLYDSNVINGKGEGVFAPKDNVTREEFAKMLALAFDIKAEGKENSFTDVKDGAWYAEYVNTLASANIVNGRNDGSFGTGDYITREDIAVMIDRALTYKGIQLEGKEVDAEDSDFISAYAKEAISKMCAKGIISGFDDGSLRPKDFADRAQTAQLIYKAVMLLK